MEEGKRNKRLSITTNEFNGNGFGKRIRITIECNHKWKIIGKEKAYTWLFRREFVQYILQCEHCGIVMRR